MEHMEIKGKKIGIALTGSFCTFEKTFAELQKLADTGADIYPILSDASQTIESRFGKPDTYVTKIKAITGKEPIVSIPGAEPIGPKAYLDVLAILPCTGNTAAKLANGITDTPVLMAAKAHMRNNKPLVIAITASFSVPCRRPQPLQTPEIMFDIPNAVTTYTASQSAVVPGHARKQGIRPPLLTANQSFSSFTALLNSFLMFSAASAALSIALLRSRSTLLMSGPANWYLMLKNSPITSSGTTTQNAQSRNTTSRVIGIRKISLLSRSTQKLLLLPFSSSLWHQRPNRLRLSEKLDLQSFSSMSIFTFSVCVV